MVIFPPWINRFYILDLTPEKSFVKWCVDQGVSPVHGQLEIGRREHRRRWRSTIMCSKGRSTRSTRSATCSASRACTPSAIASPARRWRRRSPISMRKSEQAKVKSATFFTAQVDFTRGRRPQAVPRRRDDGAAATQLTAEKGYLDGRYMAATFNLLRGRDLIWSYVVNNYLLGEEPAPFDLLHWNSDTTNLPAGWHRDYLETLYKGNKLVENGGITRRRHADRHQQGEDADLHPGRAARTISRRRKACGRSWTISRATSASCSPARATSPAWSTRRRPANINIGSTTSRAATLESFVEGADRAQGQLVARLARVAEEAGARRRSRRRARGCPARASSRRSRTRRGATSRRAERSVAHSARPDRGARTARRSAAARSLRARRISRAAARQSRRDRTCPPSRSSAARSRSPSVDGRVAGFAVIARQGRQAELDGLFVEPDCGAGALAPRWSKQAVHEARRRGLEPDRRRRPGRARILRKAAVSRSKATPKRGSARRSGCRAS